MILSKFVLSVATWNMVASEVERIKFLFIVRETEFDESDQLAHVPPSYITHQSLFGKLVGQSLIFCDTQYANASWPGRQVALCIHDLGNGHGKTLEPVPFSTWLGKPEDEWHLGSSCRLRVTGVWDGQMSNPRYSEWAFHVSPRHHCQRLHVDHAAMAKVRGQFQSLSARSATLTSTAERLRCVTGDVWSRQLDNYSHYSTNMDGFSLPESLDTVKGTRENHTEIPDWFD